jgi:putative toxin-antitoxin system antitoxin component (TIGR02293 family)
MDNCPMPARAHSSTVRRPRPASEREAPAPAAIGTYDLLGGRRLLKHEPASRADIHDILVSGLPYAVLFHLADHIQGLSEADIASVIGVSARTLRRQREAPGKTMPIDLASKTWLLAETLARAAHVLGGPEAAQRWMSQPAMGLDGGRPIDLLRTLQGTELVTEFLGRLEHGVYN